MNAFVSLLTPSSPSISRLTSSPPPSPGLAGSRAYTGPGEDNQNNQSNPSPLYSASPSPLLTGAMKTTGVPKVVRAARTVMRVMAEKVVKRVVKRVGKAVKRRVKRTVKVEAAAGTGTGTWTSSCICPMMLTASISLK